MAAVSVDIMSATWHTHCARCMCHAAHRPPPDEVGPCVPTSGVNRDRSCGKPEFASCVEAAPTRAASSSTRTGRPSPWLGETRSQPVWLYVVRPGQPTAAHAALDKAARIHTLRPL